MSLPQPSQHQGVRLVTLADGEVKLEQRIYIPETDDLQTIRLALNIEPHLACDEQVTISIQPNHKKVGESNYSDGDRTVAQLDNSAVGQLNDIIEVDVPAQTRFLKLSISLKGEPSTNDPLSYVDIFSLSLTRQRSRTDMNQDNLKIPIGLDPNLQCLHPQNNTTDQDDDNCTVIEGKHDSQWYSTFDAKHPNTFWSINGYVFRLNDTTCIDPRPEDHTLKQNRQCTYLSIIAR